MAHVRKEKKVRERCKTLAWRKLPA